jgi:C4-type Zn-finger protein
MTDEEKTTNMEERIAKIEGILEQINERLNHFGTEMGDLRKYVETELRGKADKWEIRIWFIILIAVMSVLTSLILG